MLTVHSIVNSPVPSNCFVLYDKAIGDDCIVVDPGSKSNSDLLSFLDKEGLNPKFIILTHEHFDHCWGVNELVKEKGIPIICSASCAQRIRSEKLNCSVFYDNHERFSITSKTISVESIGNQLQFAGENLHFFSTLGHSDGSICFICRNSLFTGDTLIKDTRTVTKLPTGSVEKLKASITLIQEMKGQGLLVYPGHGDIFDLDSYDLQKAI